MLAAQAAAEVATVEARNDYYEAVAQADRDELDGKRGGKRGVVALIASRSTCHPIAGWLFTESYSLQILFPQMAWQTHGCLKSAPVALIRGFAMLRVGRQKIGASTQHTNLVHYR